MKMELRHLTDNATWQ